MNLKFWKRTNDWAYWADQEERRSLPEILQSYPTDKYLNGYAEVYEELFEPIRDEVKELLEIGVFKGGSLQVWEEFFPKATIVGIDKELEFVDKPLGARIFGMWIDVNEPLQLAAAQTRHWDIVIDDGSHRKKEIKAAYDGLWPMVKPGGYYIIEDVEFNIIWNILLSVDSGDREEVTRYPELKLVVIKKCK